MGNIPTTMIAGGQTVVSSARTASPQQVAAPFYELSETFSKISQLKEESEKREGRTKFSEQYPQILGDVQKMENDLRIAKQDDPSGYSGEYIAKAKDIFDNYKKQSTNPYYVESINERYNSFLSSAMPSVIEKEAKLKTANQTQRISRAIDSYSNLSFQNPSSVAAYDELIKEDIELAKQSSLMPDSEGMYLEAKKNIYKNAINGLMESGRIEQATLLLENNKGVFGEDLSVVSSKINSIVQSTNEQYQKLSRVENFIAGKQVADPFDKKDRDLINTAFVSMGLDEKISGGDIGAATQALDIYKKTKIVPDSAQKAIRGLLANGDNEQKKYALNFMSAVHESDSAYSVGAGSFAEKEIQDGLRFQALSQVVGDNKALEFIEKQRQPEFEKTREIFEKKYQNKNLSKKINASKFDKVLSTGFFDFATNDNFLANQIEESAVNEFEFLFKENYLLMGDEEAALDVTQKMLSRVYGVTEIFNGKKIMKYAPEKISGHEMLTPKENAEWMRNDLKKTIDMIETSKTGVDANTNIEDYFIVPTSAARRDLESGVPVGYYIFKNDGTLILNEKRQPVEFYFDKKAGEAAFNSKTEEDQADSVRKINRALYQKVMGVGLDETGMSPLQRNIIMTGSDLKKKLGNLIEDISK